MPKFAAALNQTFTALADPTRRAMVERLARGPASVTELARPLPMSLPAVVQHLQVLEAAGLVTSEKTGRVRTCRIDPQTLGVAQDWLAQQRSVWTARFDRLDAFLMETKDDD
ncbi:MAG: metalloregulator ArsR/SmtB family transcription factor [Hyphomonadaceae bacterium]|nr:metalloregulator ArsR/SmtB family transcription factor [Hyphomonadaceae bacterium]